MRDYQLVEAATIAPHQCVVSGDTVGPMIDTEREVVIQGRVYVSVAAVVRLARAAGLVEGGEKYNELLHSMQTLRQRDRELKRLAADRADALAEAERLGQLLEEQQAYEAWAKGRIQQLEDALRADAQGLLDVVGAA